MLKTLKYVSEYSGTFLFIMLSAVLIHWYLRKKKYKLPPGPLGFRHLGGEPFKELNRLKKIYGNVFSLYIGWTYTVIVDDFEVMKEAYSKTMDKSTDFDILPDGLGFSGHNGEEWTEQRRFGVKSMRDHGVGKEKWESEVQGDVNNLIQLVSAYKGQPVDILKQLTSSISNNISSFVLGKRLPFEHPDRIFLDNVMDEIMLLLGQAPSRSLLPSLQDICIALRVGKVYKNLKRFNNFFRKETEKLRRSYMNGEHKSFIVDYLIEMENRRHKPGHFFSEKNLYGNIQGLFLGASETTRTAIYWLFLIMAKFPKVQARVQDELDSELGESGEIRWSTRSKVPYTFATIMEGQRWRTLTPLNSPRISTKDLKLQNYDIPGGTPIIVNIWGIHNDPKYWKDPEKFDPERFLSVNGREITARPDSYIPFSYGKRNCPGESIALMEILLYFTTFLQNFTISAPEGTDINLDGIQCITYQAIPQKLRFVPRKNN